MCVEQLVSEGVVEGGSQVWVVGHGPLSEAGWSNGLVWVE